jgi:hypothetical protein
MKNISQTEAGGSTGLQEILMVEDSATDAELALRAFKLRESGRVGTERRWRGAAHEFTRGGVTRAVEPYSP